MKKETVFAIGSYTVDQPHVPVARGRGVTFVSLDSDAGNLIEKDVFIEMRNPSYLAWSQENRLLISQGEDSRGGELLQAHEIDDKGSPQEIGEAPGAGGAACHLVLNNKCDTLFSVSYDEGSISLFSMDKEGKPRLKDSFTYVGSGPNKDRQEKPHAHQVIYSADEQFLYVCDLGSDRIWLHDPSSDDLTPREALRIPPGYGPRHLALDPQLPFAYILCELEPRLLVAGIREDGTMSIIQNLPTVEDDLMEMTAPAAIKIHPSGQALAVSNRFSDTIAFFTIVREGESLQVDLSTSIPAGGKTPRDITFSRCGKWLLVANQDSDDICLYSLDRETGLPMGSEPSGKFETGSPVCLVELGN